MTIFLHINQSNGLMIRLFNHVWANERQLNHISRDLPDVIISYCYFLIHRDIIATCISCVISPKGRNALQQNAIKQVFLKTCIMCGYYSRYY